MRRYEIRGRILDRVLKPIWKQVKNASRNVVRKEGSRSTEKRRCRVKYTKNKTKSAKYGWNRIYHQGKQQPLCQY